MVLKKKETVFKTQAIHHKGATTASRYEQQGKMKLL
jgi:hypothetical protein